MRYRTKAGDMLDAVCFDYYGRTAGVVEKVLEANPRLAECGPVFEAGVVIELPELPAPVPNEGVSLWD